MPVGAKGKIVRGTQQPGKWGTASYNGEPGMIVARLPVPAKQTNLWWRADTGDTEIMFSKRADGQWRAFPGPADGPGLVSANL
jgi:hypothetical protein